MQRVAGTVDGRRGGCAYILLTVDDRTALEVIIVVLFAVAASIRFVNYAWYTAAMAAALLTAMDVPHPSSLADEGRRILFTFAGVGIAVIVMFLADRLKTRAAAAAPKSPQASTASLQARQGCTRLPARRPGLRHSRRCYLDLFG